MVQMFVNSKMRQGSWHKNGGGFVESTATVEETVYLGPSCKVVDLAQVLDVCYVDGQVIISHEAVVSGGSRLTEHVWIRDKAKVFGAAILSGYSVVKDQAQVNGGTMTDQAVARAQDILHNVNLHTFQSLPTEFPLGANG